MSIFESIFSTPKSRFLSDMEEVMRQVLLSFSKIQEGMRHYLLNYIEARSLPRDDNVIEGTFTWLISGTSPPGMDQSLSRRYIEGIKTSPLVSKAFATAMALKVNMLTSRNLMSEAMRIVKNLNELGIPVFSLDMCLPNERAFIAMADDFFNGSKDIPVPIGEGPPGGFPTLNEKRYEIRNELGRGGYGVVNLAYDKTLRREVAVKRLLVDQRNPRHSEFIQRFKREAQIIASLNHPNIVQVFDCETSVQGFSIVMEYVRGGSLDKLLAEDGGKMPANKVYDLGMQISDGLAHAHGKGIIHRDLKPQNILIEKDGSRIHAKIADFGIARGDHQGESIGTIGGIGTPLYMAPEQRTDARNVTAAADIYSLGKMILEMLTGDVGYEVDATTMDLPVKWKPIMARCTHRNSAMRYINADAFRTDFASLQTEKARL